MEIISNVREGIQLILKKKFLYIVDVIFKSRNNLNISLVNTIIKSQHVHYSG